MMEKKKIISPERWIIRLQRLVDLAELKKICIIKSSIETQEMCDTLLKVRDIHTLRAAIAAAAR